MTAIQDLIRQIEIKLPEISLSDINLDELMNLDFQGDLVGRYQKDLLLFSFFSLLGRKIKIHLEQKKNELEDLESTLYSELVKENPKIAATEAKNRIKCVIEYRVIRNQITEIEGKHSLIEGLVDSLTKKSIGLNVLTARERAEIASGLK